MNYKFFIPLSVFFLTSFAIQPYRVEKKIIMAIFAHPDDEFTVSPLLTKYANEGHTVYLVIATKGELGVSEHAKIPAGDTLANVRAQEAACSCEKLGIKPPILLGFGDGSLSNDFMRRPLRGKIDSVIKLYQPDVVITWGPDGGYGHMDHRMVHNIVTELFQSGNYLNPQELFYTGIPTENWRRTPNFKTEGIKRMYGSWKPVKKEYLTVQIRCSQQELAKAEAALKCNQSQFSKEQMEDIMLFMTNTGRDTVFLRPFKPLKKVFFNLFQ